MTVVKLIEEQATKTPQKKAVIFPKGEKATSYTYKELINYCGKLSIIFREEGIEKGSRVLLFVKPSLNFSVITFSLFKLGAIPVFIDPGMGLKNLLNSVKKTKPSFFVTEKKGIILKFVFNKSFKSIKKTFCTKNFLWFSSVEKSLKKNSQKNKEITFPDLTSTDLASFIFTSGGTGKPKAVVYTHGMFLKQVELLKKEFNYLPHDRDLPGFPLFSMLTIAMGVTSVIPELDPSKPDLCKPEKIVANILEHKVTTVAGSPAIWERVGSYCKENSIKLPTVRALIMFGAPIPERLHRLFENILPNGTSYTPYGATECLPLSNISAKELKEAKLPKGFPYKAICVGKIIEPTKVLITEETEEESFSLEKLQKLPSYEIGEILVQGDQASPYYLEEEKATLLSKIKDKDLFWHKMGDLGFIDKEKRLWFCGRKVHKVRTDSPSKNYYSIPTENLFSGLPGIKKAALITLKNDEHIKPALVFERYDKRVKLTEEENHVLKNKIIQIKKSHEEIKEISDFFFYKTFPVDKRHNIKVDRQFLSRYFSERPQKHL